MTGLKKSLGLADTVAINVGAIIGAGIFALTGVAGGICGPALPLAYAIAAIPMALALVPIGMLASVLPTAGGSFRYPSRILSPFWGFIGVWGIMMGILLGGMPMYALTFADFVRDVWPVLDRTTIAALALAVFFVLNVVGVKSASIAQVVMFVVLIAALLTYAVTGLTVLDPERVAPMFHQDALRVLNASGMLFFAYLGANFIIDMGAEIKDAGRVIPRSLAISLPIVIVLYVLIGLATVGAVPRELYVDLPLSVPARAFMSGPLALFFTLGGGLLALATTINATYMFASRFVMVLAEDGVFPQALGAVNRRFGTPHWGLCLMFVVSMISLPFGATAFSALGMTASIGSIVLLIPILVSAMRFPRKMPELYARAPFKLRGPWLWIVPGVALLFGAAFVVALVLESPRGAALLAGWMLGGVVYYHLRDRQLRRRGGRGLAAIAERGLV
jgi:APA family basic amino acid/polyamine antiporter